MKKTTASEAVDLKIKMNAKRKQKAYSIKITRSHRFFPEFLICEPYKKTAMALQLRLNNLSNQIVATKHSFCIACNLFHKISIRYIHNCIDKKAPGMARRKFCTKM